jgi:hypothetical protein
MKRKINKKTFLIIAILLIIAMGTLVLTNTDRIAVQLAPKKQAAKSRSETATKADELFWQTFHNGEYEKIPRAGSFDGCLPGNANRCSDRGSHRLAAQLANLGTRTDRFSSGHNHR